MAKKKTLTKKLSLFSRKQKTPKPPVKETNDVKMTKKTAFDLESDSSIEALNRSLKAKNENKENMRSLVEAMKYEREILYGNSDKNTH